MDDHMEAQQQYYLSLSIVNEAQHSSSHDEFNRHVEDFISAYSRYAGVFFYKDTFPVWEILQLCCNRQENISTAYVLTVIGCIDYTVISSLLFACFLNGTAGSLIDGGRPLLPYLLECALRTNLRLSGIKLSAYLQLNTHRWTGDEIDSLRTFLKYGGGLEMSRNRFTLVVRNLLRRVVEAVRSSWMYDPVTFLEIANNEGPNARITKALEDQVILILCFWGQVELPSVPLLYPLLPYLMEKAQENNIQINGRRFSLCFNLDDPRLMWNERQCSSLTTLLKFGVGFDIDRRTFHIVLTNILWRLMEACVLTGFWHEETWQRQEGLVISTTREAINDVNRLRSCFRMFVNEAKHPAAACSERRLSEFLTEEMPRGEALLSFYDSLYPGQNYGRNDPPSLQHLCRVAIRQRLHDNYNLPNGVNELHLTHTARNYLTEEYNN